MKNYSRQQKIAFATYGIGGAIVFGITMMLINGGFSLSNLKSVLLPTLFFALFIGLIFPLIMKAFSPKLENKIKVPQFSEPENLIFEGKANLQRSWWEAAGGKLFLTNKRLVFSGLKYFSKEEKASIELDQIDSIQKKKTSFLVDNRLRIKTSNNSTFDFVVDHRNQWLEELNNRQNI